MIGSTSLSLIFARVSSNADCGAAYVLYTSLRVALATHGVRLSCLVVPVPPTYPTHPQDVRLVMAYLHVVVDPLRSDLWLKKAINNPTRSLGALVLVTTGHSTRGRLGECTVGRYSSHSGSLAPQ